MKKLLSLTLLAGTISFYACGPSAEEQAKQAKAAQDSIAAADSMMRDAEAQAMEAAKTDSMAPMDSSKMMSDTTKKM
ncbi:MAG: hypothetical protein ABI855_19505 [Bacteroidota bacterium]